MLSMKSTFQSGIWQGYSYINVHKCSWNVNFSSKPHVSSSRVLMSCNFRICLCLNTPDSNNMVIGRTLENLTAYWGGNLAIWFGCAGPGIHLKVAGHWSSRTCVWPRCSKQFHGSAVCLFQFIVLLGVESSEPISGFLWPLTAFLSELHGL